MIYPEQQDMFSQNSMIHPEKRGYISYIGLKHASSEGHWQTYPWNMLNTGTF
jgi:hypothetical protein